MGDHRRLLRFLRDCYEADNRETGVTNLLAQEVRHLIVPLMAGELLSGTLDRVPLPREAALAASKDAALFAAEKSLYLAVLVLAGVTRDQHKTRVFAPLLLAPATIEDAEPYAFARVDFEGTRLNARLLTRLIGEDGGTAALDELAERLPRLPLPADRMVELVDGLRALFPDLDPTAMARYPELLDETALRAEAAVRTPRRIRLLPGAALVLLPTSPDTRQVLSELATLAEATRLSPPLTALLQPGPSARPRRFRPVPLPASLSRAQQALLASAASRTLTVAVGPPGTGKSFTVAALALDHAARGESVLIAARTAQALDVIAAKLDELAGAPLALPCGRRGAQERLAALLEGLPEDSGTKSPAHTHRVSHEVKHLQRLTRRLDRAIASRLALEQRWGRLSESVRTTGLGGLLGRRRLDLLSWWLGHARPLWDLAAEQQRVVAKAQHAIGRWLHGQLQVRAAAALATRRGDLVAVARALRTRTKLRLAEVFAEVDREVLFAALPIWLARTSELGELLPLERELFALTIVDEATQCDPASLLPALHRASRAVLTGDPRQLRHVSFLSRVRLQALASRYELTPDEAEHLSYRDRAALDVALDSASCGHQVVMLDEHFRSRPGIIDFSNRELYGERLKVMTRRPATVRQRTLELRRIPGRRNAHGINSVEAEALLAELDGWVAAERPLPGGVRHTLGVLSPFREQVDHLAARIARAHDAETITRHRVLVGTAHAFQGEERDIMLLSLGIDGGTPVGAVRFLTRPDVFNVSITRARELQVVFCSLPAGSYPEGLLGRYLHHVETTGREELPTDSRGDVFLDEVAAALRQAGLAVWPRYRVAGREVDLIVERGGHTVGIDLVGAPGEVGSPEPAERVCLLRRAGLPLVPLPLSAWRRDRSACLRAVHDALA